MCACALAACSAFVSLDGLRESDAGTEAGVDATSDAADGSMTVDSPAADAGPDVFRFPCTDASIICDNFDESPLGARWSNMSTTGLAMMGVDGDAGLSPPNSLLVTVLDNPNWDGRSARLEKSISNLKSLDCEFSFRIDATTATMDYDVEPFGLNLNVGGFVDYELWVNLTSTELSFEQSTDNGGEAGASGSVDLIIGGIMTGVWRTVHFTSDFQRVQFAIDGTPVFDKPLMVPIAQATGDISVGLVYDSEPASWTYRIDDVLCK
jgi:hypothetical protein